MLKNLAQPETMNSQHYDFVVVGSAGIIMPIRGK